MNTPSILRLLISTFVALSFFSLSAGSVAARDDVATVSMTPSAIYWQPQIPYEQITLTVSGPEGVSSDTFPNGVSPALQAFNLADGSYNYELTVTPVIDEAVRAELMAARESGDMSVVTKMKRRGFLPSGPMQQSGHFRVVSGEISVDNTPEGRGKPR